MAFGFLKKIAAAFGGKKGGPSSAKATEGKGKQGEGKRHRRGG